MIKRAFALGCFASGDDANDFAIVAFAMTDDEQPCSRTQPEQQKAIFGGRVLIVKELNCEFVVENRFGLLEGNTVLSEVRGGFGRIPFKPDHQYIVFMIDGVSSCAVFA